MDAIRPDDLRRIDILRDLAAERLEELVQHGTEHTLDVGDYLFHGNDTATAWWLLLEGQLETTIAIAGDERHLLHHDPGGFLGAISLITGEPLRGSTRASMPSRVFFVEPEAFRRLVVAEPAVFQAVMDVFFPVISEITSIERDREKLLALGSLAAGLAHELNNPAAAAQRGAAELQAAEARAQGALARLAEHGLGAEPMARLCTYTAEAVASSGDSEPGDALERADHEAALEAWLAEHGVADGYELAPALADAGIDAAWVERLLAFVPPEQQADVLTWVSSRLSANRIARELGDATTRISQLVQAVRAYSYLDQTPQQEVDVHDLLESTLAILQHKISASHVTVVREYDSSLPHIDAHAPELNQVWTNLIDNAVAAAGEGGTVTLRTLRAGDYLVVEVEDDGPGVPDEIANRVFDAFFTTKEPGEGTGLGLDIAKRIVTRHRGELKLKPVESGACFQVLLPLSEG